MITGEILQDYLGKSFPMESFVVVQCLGSDVARFLNGQLANDVSELGDNTFQQQVRLNRSGQVQFFFYLLKNKEHYFILVDKKDAPELIADLDKFIIMDDVAFESTTMSLCLAFTYENVGFKGRFAHLPASLIPIDQNSFAPLDQATFRKLSLLGAEPVMGVSINKGQLVTDTTGMLSAVSLSKGCFLGQETVAKIESRRGGAYFPVLLNVEQESHSSDDLYLEGKKVGKRLEKISIGSSRFELLSLIRHQRVVGKEIHFEDGLQGKVQYLPLWDYFDSADQAKFLYEKGVQLFQEGDEEQAMALLNEAIDLKNDYADAYESLGVILGRRERYEEAIALMNKLQEIDDSSVMAHTNKSLYLMKLGKIEEAEEEKAQATVKSFASFGKKAQEENALKEKKEFEKKELERREAMFREVLTIDEHDLLANMGLADIEYKRKNYKDAESFLKNVLQTDAKYSVAYVLMAKTCLALNKKQEALSTLEKGIAVASANGDLMPANEMQEIFNREKL